MNQGITKRLDVLHERANREQVRARSLRALSMELRLQGQDARERGRDMVARLERARVSA
jgi:hypothetical protein